MKTTTRNKASKGKKSGGPRKGSTRRTIESRDLNVDDQATNVPAEEEGSEKKLNDVTLPSDRSVEDEEDREAKRKIADANPPEDVQN